LQALLILPVAVPARNAVGFVLLSYDYANARGVIRSSAHVVEKQEKTVADTGADEHLVALPNRSARRLPQAGPAPGVIRGPTPALGPADDYCFALSSFSKSYEHAGALGTARLDYDGSGGGIQVLLSM
jgi:hypothetical protein